jgi:hypothetical protein
VTLPATASLYPGRLHNTLTRRRATAISPRVRERFAQTDTGGNGKGNPWEGLLAVAQAFYRWQNTYSPAGTLEQEFSA